MYTGDAAGARDRKSTRLNSSHLVISYAVFCLKKKIADTYDYSPPEMPHREGDVAVYPPEAVAIGSQVLYWTTWSDFFFFNDTATTEIYTLSLHDALPI